MHLFAQDYYEVQAGDTLSRIATNHGVSVAAISEVNGITDPTRLRIGQRLKIPAAGSATRPSSASVPLFYTVVAGDTIYGIARKMEISANDLMEANNLNTSSVLRIGQRLQLPVGGRAARGTSDSNSQPPPPPNPEPEAAAIETTQEPPTQTQVGRPLEHRVASGDTLSGIGARYGISASAIAAANRIQVNSILRIGQVLRIPANESIAQEVRTQPRAQVVEQAPDAASGTVTEHTVRPGEDLQTIANRYELSVEKLREWNDIGPGQYLRVGQIIRLTAPPAGRAQATTPRRTPEPTDPPARGVTTRSRASTSANTESSAPSASRETSSRGSNQQSFAFIRPVKSAIDRPRIKRGRWRYVVVHHSETKSGNAAIFDRYHRNVRKWENGLAYHFVIGNGRGSGDGQIEVGDRWTQQLHGGHLRSLALNEISIGICLVGSYNVERPTSRQIASTIELVEYLRRICGNPRLEFTIHRLINPTPTDCPGKLFPERTMFQRLR